MKRNNKVEVPIGWPGGKRLLEAEIIKRIPEDHVFYGEVFGGSFRILLRKEPSKAEAANDINSELINFFRVVKTAPQELILSLQWDLVSRETFNEYQQQLKQHQTTGNISNVERAKMFFYCLKTSFGGMSETFGTTTTTKLKLNLKKVNGIIRSVHNRLKQVTIENLDWEKFLETYDRKHSFFYIDPPYRCKSSGRMYVQSLTDRDFRKFKGVLKHLEGRFLLSLNKDDFICNLFKDFEIEEVYTNYSLNKTTGKRVTELLIRNY